MQESRMLEGVVPVVVTPLTTEEEIDTKALVRLVDFLIESGVGGMWALGTGSEDMNLSFDKRLTVAQTIAEANRGRVPLIMGAGFFALEDSHRFIEETSDLEFDAHHVMPYHPLLSLERMAWMYRRLAKAAPRPIWMYTSANWCRPFPPDFVADLCDEPNIAGIKFSSSKTTDQLKVAKLADPSFQVITAVVAQFFVCLSMGVKAGTTSMASALPDAIGEIYQHFVGGDREAALAAQYNLIGFLDALPKTAKADNFLGAAEEKYILSLRGICDPKTSSYYRDLDTEEQAAVRSALEKFGYLERVNRTRNTSRV